MRHMIVTGASKGLGEAIVDHLLQSVEDISVTIICRNENNRLKKKASQERKQLAFYKADLSDVSCIDPLMEQVFNKIDVMDATGLYLVNNAGIVEPVGPLSRCKSDDIVKNLHVNLAAPMVMTSAFIRLSERMAVEKRVATITSGASRRAEFGWSAYCSAKAGVNLFTGCAAMEEKDKRHGVKLIAFSPGIMDTDMQQRIRNTSGDDFKEVDTFIRYKEEGDLTPPAMVAEKLVNVLLAKEMPSGEVVSYRDIAESGN